MIMKILNLRERHLKLSSKKFFPFYQYTKAIYMGLD